MIKSITLAYRRPELSREEFSRYWRETHGPMAASQIPGLRRYVQNHFISVPDHECEGDGIVEMWYDDLEAWQNSLLYLQTPEGRPLAEDGAKFSQHRPGYHWVVQEHIVKDELK